MDTMELSSSSDSEDCELYTKAAVNVEMRRKKLQVEREEFEKLINLVPEKDIEKISKIGYVTNVDDLLNTTEVEAISSDLDDDIPLAELQKSLRRESKPRSCNKRRVNSSVKTSKRGRPNKKSNKSCDKISNIPENFSYSSDSEGISNICSESNQGVIILDDDTGYPTSFDPIDFNSRRKTKPKANMISSETSFNSTLNVIDSDGDESFDNETVVTLSIEWHNGKQCSRKEFKLRRYQKLETVYDELAKLEGIPKNRVMLLRDFNLIKPTDTPTSLNLKYYGALSGAISKTDLIYDTGLTKKTEETVPAEGELVVKLQLETKTTLHVTILKNDKMIVLYEKCSEELQCPIDKLKINFDGEIVDPSEKPQDLDLEGGEIFHVYIKN